MNIRRIILPTIVISFTIPIQIAGAATIPADTIMSVRTEKNIYARDPAGRRFETRLARPVAAQGKVLVPTGTTVMGKVKSPWFTVASSTRRLTLLLREIVIHGKSVPIKTEEFEAENPSPARTRGGAHVTLGAFILKPGTILQFRLKEPMNI